MIIKQDGEGMMFEFNGDVEGIEDAVDAFLSLPDDEFQSMGNAIWLAAQAWNHAQEYRNTIEDGGGH